MSTIVPNTIPQNTPPPPPTNPEQPKHTIGEKIHNFTEGVKSLFRPVEPPKNEIGEDGKPIKPKSRFEDRFPELREDFPSPSLVDKASLWP